MELDMNTQLKDEIAELKESAEFISVLYVEDEDMIRKRISLFLQKIFKNVVTAKDGEEGLQKFSSGRYDIVITDIKMPKMNGIELIDAIRHINKRQEIIVVSAHTDAEFITQCIVLQVTGYILKPVDFTQILETLKNSILKIQVFRENELYKIKLESMVEERTTQVLSLKDDIINNNQ